MFRTSTLHHAQAVPVTGTKAVIPVIREGRLVATDLDASSYAHPINAAPTTMDPIAIAVCEAIFDFRSQKQ